MVILQAIIGSNNLLTILVMLLFQSLFPRLLGMKNFNQNNP